MPSVRVIGIGQRAAGDDGAGLAVLDALRRAELPAEVECLAVAEPSAMLPLLCTQGRVIIVDAVVASTAGDLLELAAHQVGAAALCSLSSHGLSVPQAIELARATEPSRICADIRILGITIARPLRLGEGLSPAVEAAVQRAKERLCKLLREE